MDIHSNYHCLEHLQREFSLKCLKLLKVRAFWIASAMTKATFQRHSRWHVQPSPTLPLSLGDQDRIPGLSMMTFGLAS